MDRFPFRTPEPCVAVAQAPASLGQEPVQMPGMHAAPACAVAGNPFRQAREPVPVGAGDHRREGDLAPQFRKGRQPVEDDRVVAPARKPQMVVRRGFGRFQGQDEAIDSGGLHEARAQRDAVGVVDQDVDPAEGLDGGGDGTVDIGGAVHVRNDGNCLAAGSLDLAARVVQLGLGAADGGDPGAFLGERQGDALPDTLTGAGNQRDLAIQNSHHVPFCLNDDRQLLSTTPLGIAPGSVL